jgi:hypothetical protein
MVVVERAPQHPILPYSSRISTRLYGYDKRRLPVGACVSLRLMLGYARHNLRKDPGSMYRSYQHYQQGEDSDY